MRSIVRIGLLVVPAACAMCLSAGVAIGATADTATGPTTVTTGFGHGIRYHPTSGAATRTPAAGVTAGSFRIVGADGEVDLLGPDGAIMLRVPVRHAIAAAPTQFSAAGHHAPTPGR